MPPVPYLVLWFMLHAHPAPVQALPGCPNMTFRPLSRIMNEDGTHNLGVPEFYSSDLEAALRCRSLGSPIIVREVLTSVANWTPWHLATATQEIPWKTYAATNPHMAKGINTWVERLTLASFLEHLQQNPDSCNRDTYRSCGLFLYPRFPARFLPAFASSEIANLFKMLSFGSEELEPVVRVAGKGTQWGAHYDQPHNHMVQLYGSKRVILFPHSEVDALGILEDRHTGINPMQSAHQLDVRAAKVELHPGDILYVPPGTIHFTEGMELNVMFNQFSGFGRPETLGPP